LSVAHNAVFSERDRSLEDDAGLTGELAAGDDEFFRVLPFAVGQCKKIVAQAAIVLKNKKAGARWARTPEKCSGFKSY
jgi:hypothetical protein